MLSELTFDSLNDGDGPLVSVIIPTYEDSDYLPGAIRSVVQQSYRPIEIVIVDSSGVAEIEEFALENSGFTYQYQDPMGLGAARNAGIKKATGEVIAFLDADDRWQSGKLDLQMSAINDGAGFVYSDVSVQSNDDTQYLSALPVERPLNHHVDFFRYGGIPCPTVVVTRDCLNEARFDETLTAVEDRHMWVRLLACEDCEPERIAEPLAVYHQRDDSMSSDVENMYQNEKRVILDLVETFDELSQYRSEALARADYKRGKRYLRTNRREKARQALWKSIDDELGDRRAYLLLALTYLPLPTGRSLATLERVQSKIRRVPIP